jgi:hypothetical protein
VQIVQTALIYYVVKLLLEAFANGMFSHIPVRKLSHSDLHVGDEVPCCHEKGYVILISSMVEHNLDLSWLLSGHDPQNLIISIKSQVHLSGSFPIGDLSPEAAYFLFLRVD